MTIHTDDSAILYLNLLSRDMISAWLRFSTSFQVQKEGAQQEIITSLAPIIIISIFEQTVFNTAYLV